MTLIKNIRYNLIDLDIKRLEVDDSSFDKKNKNSSNVEFKTGVVSEDKNVVLCNVLLNMKFGDITVVEVDLYGVFEIQKTDWDKCIKDDKTGVVFPKGFIQTIIGHLYSTLRGVLLLRFKDTKLESVILPLVNLDEIAGLDEDPFLEFSEKTNS